MGALIAIIIALPILIAVGTPVLLLVSFGLVGRSNERKHMAEMDEREAKYKHIITNNLKNPPANWQVRRAGFVDGQVVIGSDYYKTFAAKLRNFFGGEVKSFESLMDRARREARLRMIEKASKKGANAVLNIRMETSTIGRSNGPKGLPMAEIHAYGTAMIVDFENTATEQ